MGPCAPGRSHRELQRFLVVAAVALVDVSRAAAQELPEVAHWSGPEMAISAPSGVLALDPDVAATPTGQALVVWRQAERADPASLRLLARLRHADGSWGPVFELAAGPVLEPPTVTSVGAHGFAVSWLDSAGGGVRLVDAAGQARPRVVLPAELGGVTGLWRVLLMPPGRLLATWTETARIPPRRQEISLRTRLFGRLGRPVGPGSAMVTTAVGDGFSFRKIDLASNGIAAVSAAQSYSCWFDGPGGGECASGGAIATRLGLDGEVGDGFLLGPGATYAPAVATTPGGSFVAVWNAFEDCRAGDCWGETGVFARRLDRDASPIGDEEMVNTTPLESDLQPAVAVDPTGGFLVVWDGRRGQALDANDTRFGSELAATTGIRTKIREVAAVGAADYLLVGSEEVAGDANGYDRRVTVQQLRLGPSLVALSADLVGSDELGSPAELTVALRMAPGAPVTVHLAVDPPGAAELEPSALVFSPDDWAVPQTVTVRGRDDGQLVGDVAAAITTSPLHSDDPRFAGYDPPDVRLRRQGEPPCEASLVSWYPGFLAAGSPKAIGWSLSGEGCGNLRLDLVRGEEEVAVIAEDLPPSTSSFTWAPSEVPLAADYRVRLTMPSRPHLVAFSMPFWAGPAIACAAGVSTPRPLESWQLGQTYRIRWHTKGTCAGRWLRIELDGKPLVARVPSADGNLRWTVPANLAVGYHNLVLIDADDPRARSQPRYFQVEP